VYQRLYLEYLSFTKVLITIMEGAVRVFAGDFTGATLTVPDDDAGNPARVVTPGGAWCRSLFLCGALTEVAEIADVLHCRVADPTGAFDIVSGGRRAAITEQIRAIPVPSFIAVTGTAQLYRRNGSDAVSVRPEYVQVIDRAVRDRWITVTADMTIARLELLLAVLEGSSKDMRAGSVIRHYGLTRERLHEMTAMVGGALASVSTAPAATPTAEDDISAIIMEIIRTKSGPRGAAVQDVIDEAGAKGYNEDAVLAAIRTLVANDDCYQPQKGYVKPL
jgi:RPA family protein